MIKVQGDMNGCSNCQVTSCKTESLETQHQAMGNGFFAAASAGTFLTPVILAIVGAVYFSEDPTKQLLAGSSGFLSGMLISIFVSRLLRGKKS